MKVFLQQAEAIFRIGLLVSTSEVLSAATEPPPARRGLPMGNSWIHGADTARIGLFRVPAGRLRRPEIRAAGGRQGCHTLRDPNPACPLFDAICPLFRYGRSRYGAATSTAARAVLIELRRFLP